MLFSTSTLLTLLAATTATALPHNPLRRAGGPIPTPISSNCTVTNPLSTVNLTTTPLQPLNSTVPDQVYTAYYPPSSDNYTALADTCQEQCHGFQGCVAAVWANNVPTPAGYYGTPGGELEAACLMYGRALTEEDFGPVEVEGEWCDLVVRDISCPSS